MGKRPAQVLAESGSDLASERPWLLKLGLELALRAGQPERFHLGGSAYSVLAKQHEVTGVRDQRQPVLLPVTADLAAVGDQPCVVARPFDFHNSAFRNLTGARLPLLHLPGGIKPDVGMSGALVGKLDDAEHLGPESRAHGVDQVGERRIRRELAGRATRRPDAAQV